MTAAAHPSEKLGVEHALGCGRFWNGHDDKIRLWQYLAERIGSVKFSNAGRFLRHPRVNCQHIHSELGAKARRLAADATHADYDYGGVGQVDNLV